MTPAELEAVAQLSEMRVEALQQLTSALSGSRISLPPDDGAPGQLLWHSPTYGAGQPLLPTGIPANTLPPTAGVDHGRSLATPEPAYVGMYASEQRRPEFGQESFHAFHRDPRDRRTVFDLRARPSSPGSYDPRQHVPREPMIHDLDAYRASEAAQLGAYAAPGFSFQVPESRSGRQLEHEYPARQPPMVPRHPGLNSYEAVRQSVASAQRDDGLRLQRAHQSTYPHIDVGMGICVPNGPAIPPHPPQYSSQLYGQARREQVAYSVAQSAVRQDEYGPVNNPSPIFTPIPPSSPDPAARHLEWLQQKFDDVLANKGDPAVLASLLQQIDKAADAVRGTATPPKGVSHGGADVNTGTPEYKLSEASMLVVKDDTKSANEMIKALGLAYEAANKDTRLKIDTPPRKARQILQRLNDTMAQAVPDGPLGAAFTALAVPLGATRVPASAVPDLQKGKTPPCIAARQRLASIVSSATAGSGSAYLATLRAWRLCVSEMLTTDPRFSMWQKTYTKCLRSLCTPTLLGIVGTPTDALDMVVGVLNAMGHTDRENLLEAYQEMSLPMEPPEFGNMAQPQDLMLWYKTAIAVRMDQLQIIGMDPAVLAYLAYLQGLPDGTGDMAHALSKLRANSEGFLASDAPKTRDVILQFIAAEQDGMGTRRWNGSLRSLKPPSGHGNDLAAYVADAGPAEAATGAASDKQPLDDEKSPVKESPVKVCPRWQTHGCGYGKRCRYAHPNGERRCLEKDRVCADWYYSEDGCSRDPCKLKHPNGKSKSDAPKGAGGYNKRDLTPVGHRHTPVEKGAVVQQDPKAAEAHARKGKTRVRVRDNNPESD